MNYCFKLIISVIFLFLLTSCQSEAVGIVNVTTTQFNQIMSDQPNMMVLDIRTPEEFEEQHIKGAVNINFYRADFISKVSLLDITKPILLHCRSGSRSGQSLSIFEKLKFQKIYHLEKGIVGGFPKRN